METEKYMVLVDDDDVECMIFRRYMEKSTLKCPLKIFNSGQAFLDFIAQVEREKALCPDLVLLDINMPVMDGFAVLEKAQNLTAPSNKLEIVLFTNSDNPEEKKRAYRMGASLYVVKPSEGTQYLDFINSISQRGTF